MGTSRTRAVIFLAAALLAAGCGDSGPPPQKVDGRTQAAWKKELESHDAGKRAAAYTALAKFDKPPIDVIAQGLQDKRTRGRSAAMHALGEIGEPAGEHARALSLYLEKDAEGFDKRQAAQLRNAAMAALGKMGKTGFKAIAHLLVSREARLRARAAYTIKPLLSHLDDGVATLMRLMEDESWVVRREAVIGLGMVGKGDRRASTLLLEGLDDDDPRVARESAMALGGIGGRADHEGRALADRLYTHQTALRAAAVYGLGLMGEEAAPYLKSVADLVRNDSKQVVRIQAALAHWRIGKKTDVALPELVAGLEDEDKGLCRDALKAIAVIGPPAGETVAVVIPLLDDPALRRHAVAALGAMGPAASEALPRLEAVIEAAGGSNAALKEEATNAVSAIRAP